MEVHRIDIVVDNGSYADNSADGTQPYQMFLFTLMDSKRYLCVTEHTCLANQQIGGSGS